MAGFEPHEHPGGFPGLEEGQEHVRRFHPGLEPPGIERDASLRTLNAAHRREHAEQESAAPQVPPHDAYLSRLDARIRRVHGERRNDEASKHAVLTGLVMARELYVQPAPGRTFAAGLREALGQ